jgi:hypothetical protein
MSLPVVSVFGHRIWALQVEVATLGVVGLIAVLDLGKQSLSGQRALFVALMVAVGPMWASLSASYMTDLPAFALAMLCLALGARAVRAADLNAGVFCAALVVGFLAFTVREYAIVAPLSVCLSALWTVRLPRRRFLVMIGALVNVAAMAAIFFLWRRGLPTFQKVVLERPSLSSAKLAWHADAQSAVLVGLLAPAVLLAGPIRIVKVAWARAPRASVASGIVTLLALGGEVLHQRASASFLGPGNYILPNGTFGTETVSGTRPDLLPKPVLASSRRPFWRLG